MLWKAHAVNRMNSSFPKVGNHVIAVYSENKLQHYATAYRNHKSVGEKLGLFRFCKFFTYFFSKYITAYSLFRNHFLTEQQHDLSVAGKSYKSCLTLKIVKSLLFVETVCHFQRLPNNIKRTMTKANVQQELLWMIISGYTHEKKRRYIMYLSKTKMGKSELILEAVHSMWTA